MEDEYNQKRIHPPLWQHDYQILKSLYLKLKDLSEKIPEESIIVDYGCGTAPYAHLFQKKASRYIKIDIGRNKNADISVKEDRAIPLKSATADLILSTQVLEHVNNVELYLSECHRILKKNGWLILSTHGIWQFHPSPRDFQRYTAPGLKSVIRKFNFRILKFYSLLGPFASVTQFTLLLIAGRLGGKNFIFRFLLAIFSLVANQIIWIENKIFPADKNSDSAVYLLWAEKK